jgi:DNA-binding NarL/FixJ family response regulator
MKFMNAETKPTLSLFIPKGALLDSILDGLSSHFEMTVYETIEHGLQNESSTDLLLVEQSLLDKQQAISLSRLKQHYPDAQVLVIGPSRPIETQVAALRHGARGYFDDSLSIKKLRFALNSILHGEVWVERHVISGLIDELTHVPEITEQQRIAVESLSPKELEVANLVSHGATNKMIAQKMAITERTVKAHLTTIFQKMDLPDRLSLAIFFRDLR